MFYFFLRTQLLSLSGHFALLAIVYLPRYDNEIRIKGLVVCFIEYLLE